MRIGGAGARHAADRLSLGQPCPGPCPTEVSQLTVPLRLLGDNEPTHFCGFRDANPWLGILPPQPGFPGFISA